MSCQSCSGRLFHSTGPAVAKQRSPNWLCDLLTTHVRLSAQHKKRGPAALTTHQLGKQEKYCHCTGQRMVDESHWSHWKVSLETGQYPHINVMQKTKSFQKIYDYSLHKYILNCHKQTSSATTYPSTQEPFSLIINVLFQITVHSLSFKYRYRQYINSDIYFTTVHLYN